MTLSLLALIPKYLFKNLMKSGSLIRQVENFQKDRVRDGFYIFDRKGGFHIDLILKTQISKSCFAIFFVNFYGVVVVHNYGYARELLLSILGY